MTSQPDSGSCGNPTIRHKFTTGPTGLVHDNTVYLYTGHDEAPAGVEDYVMNEWLCFSSTDFVNWTEHSVPLRATDFAWASGDAYAKVIERGGRLYWSVAVTHATVPGKAIGVAVTDPPTGPCRFQRPIVFFLPQRCPQRRGQPPAFGLRRLSVSQPRRHDEAGL